MKRYDFASLAAAMGVREPKAARALGLSGKTEQEYRRRGMSERVADRMASKAGLHPGNVWPEWLDDSDVLASVVCPGCEGLFVPLRRSHRWCSKKCYQRVYKRDAARRRYAADPEFRARQIAKSRAYRLEHARVHRLKKRAYYLANRDELRAKRKARRSAAAMERGAA